MLSVFSEQRPTWRITDIAAEVSLPLPTAYRIVMTLTAEGYLDHLPSGEYRPGVRVLTLGTAALRSLDLVELATPKLQELANATGETVNLAVLTGDQVLYLVRLRNSDLVTANIRVGSLLPAVHTSIGKLLLAYLDDADLEKCVTPQSFERPVRPQRQAQRRRTAPRAGHDPRPGLGHAGRGTGVRPALGGRPGARRERHGGGGREPGRAVPRLAGRADHPRAAANGASPPARRSPGCSATAAGDRRMERLTKLQPLSLNADQAELYAAMTGGPRGGSKQPFRLVDDTGALTGPFNAMLLQPAVGRRCRPWARRCGTRAACPERVRELAILIVAAHWSCEFEQHAHEAAGRRAGLTEADLAAIRAGQEPDLADPAERAVVRATRTLARTGDLADEQYAAAEAELGEAGVFELTTLAGYYATLALQLRVFRVETAP